MKVAVIGGGAAGFFAAINVKENYPNASLTIFEKSAKLLSKVKISGGGRCNVTNGETSIKKLSLAYPRGEKKLKKVFTRFNTKHTIEWFENRGVALMTQEDNCVFPVSQDSQTIIDCFLSECKRHAITIKTLHPVTEVVPSENRIKILFRKDISSQIFDKVIIATGGSPKRSGLDWLNNLSLEIDDPVPSLFTFNMPSEPIKKLMGVVVENTITSIEGTKLKGDGPLLVTHWGMSGPAILKLSAFGARVLAEKKYEFNVIINWVNEANHDKVRLALSDLSKTHLNKHLSNFRAFKLPERLWVYLLEKADLPNDKKWGDLGKKGINKLVNILTHDVYAVKGKTTFKEEFVTCGGVSLSNIDFKTMRSKQYENIYFAGELLDIDGITGGYNFQSCWTTGFIAAELG